MSVPHSLERDLQLFLSSPIFHCLIFFSKKINSDGVLIKCYRCISEDKQQIRRRSRYAFEINLINNKRRDQSQCYQCVGSMQLRINKFQEFDHFLYLCTFRNKMQDDRNLDRYYPIVKFQTTQLGTSVRSQASSCKTFRSFIEIYQIWRFHSLRT